MAQNVRRGDCFLHSRGCRTQPEAECAMRRPPNECEVRAEWVRVCGSCHRRLKRQQDPELLAAVRGDTQQATPQVVRKRPAPCALPRGREELRPEEHEPKEAETYKGFIPGVSRVYGEGGVSPSLPVGVKLLIAGAHATLKRLTKKEGESDPAIQINRTREKAASREKPGGGKAL